MHGILLWLVVPDPNPLPNRNLHLTLSSPFIVRSGRTDWHDEQTGRSTMRSKIRKRIRNKIWRKNKILIASYRAPNHALHPLPNRNPHLTLSSPCIVRSGHTDWHDEQTGWITMRSKIRKRIRRKNRN